jgi:Cytochrome c7 and related cytochrome c
MKKITIEMRRVRLALMLAFCLVGAALSSVFWGNGQSLLAQSAPTASSGIPTESYEDYPAAGVDAGVWNDGQAALWDLNILDHFHYFGPDARAKGYQPEQPINFSHIVHVQKNKMDCQYCHWNVSKASYATIPEVELCMGCHKLVKGQDPASQAEIKKLDEYYAAGKQIPWKKVHVMPNHYKFNHKRHVKGGIACHECHGQVPEMPVVERASSMKMGWCVDCHREKGTSIDCYTCHY